MHDLIIIGAGPRGIALAADIAGNKRQLPGHILIAQQSGDKSKGRL